MLTKRMFIAILMVFAAAFLLFQVPQVVLQSANTYRTNVYRQTSSLKSTDVWSSSSEDTGSRYAVYIGNKDTKTGSTCREWAFYTKRSLKSYRKVSDYKPSEKADPDLVLVEKSALADKGSVKGIRRLLKAGMHVVFCSLPAADTLKHREGLLSLLGIYYVRQSSVHAKGIHLYKGLLLGGERIYQAKDHSKKELQKQDLDLDVPWFVPGAGCRVYMSAIVYRGTDKYMTNKDMPALIWRTRQENSMAYVINGDYMSDRLVGIGILDGIAADCSDYEIYPVINAQNLVLTGFPALSDENQTVMEKVYGYSQTQFSRNIMLPGLQTAIEKTGFHATAMMQPQYDYSRRTRQNQTLVTYYLRQLREMGAEAGISLSHDRSSDAVSAAGKAYSVLQKYSEGYKYSAAFLDSADLSEAEKMLSAGTGSGIRTVACTQRKDRRLFGYLDQERTLQPLLSDVSRHTFSKDLELLGTESAFGYTSVQMDMLRALWPENREDRWENLSDAMFSNLITYWKDFRAFDGTALSESDRRIRNFLALDYRTSVENAQGEQVRELSGRTAVIHLKASGFEKKCYFLLRLHNREVVDMTGGSYKKTEQNVYLLRITGNDAKITVREVTEE